MELKISSTFYSKKALEDTVYWLSESYNLLVDFSSEGMYVVKCTNADDNFEAGFLKQLNDFNLRATIAEKSSDIKNLVIAKAFYPEMITVDPVGEFQDPVQMEKSDEAK